MLAQTFLGPSAGLQRGFIRAPLVEMKSACFGVGISIGVVVDYRAVRSLLS